MKNTILNFAILSILCGSFIFFYACNDGEEMPPQQDNFDRGEMLTYWADAFIIPAYERYAAELDKLVLAKDAFIETPDSSTFIHLREAWLEAYLAWQSVSLYEIGKAEEIAYRNYVNIFPSDTELISRHITEGTYNLELPSTYDAQGFPALDYMLYGVAEAPEDIIDLLGEPKYSAYLSDLVNRLELLHTEVLADWNGGYREAFIQNDGSSGTAATDKVVNDFLFYYEKFLRAGKVGIPAGVFSGNENSLLVEAPYSSIHSKALFQEALQAVDDFFNGRKADGSQTGPSLSTYLEHVTEANNTEEIAPRINAQWQRVSQEVQGVSESFGEQVIQDNTAMLRLYDELQKAVPLLKVDMMQALNIQVDFVDADGD